MLWKFSFQRFLPNLAFSLASAFAVDLNVWVVVSGSDVLVDFDLTQVWFIHEADFVSSSSSTSMSLVDSLSPAVAWVLDSLSHLLV